MSNKNNNSNTTPKKITEENIKSFKKDYSSRIINDVKMIIKDDNHAIYEVSLGEVMIKEDKIAKMIGDLSEKMQEGFNKVNQRIDETNVRIDEVKSELKSDIKELSGRVDNLTKRVDDLTDRVVALENKDK